MMKSIINLDCYEFNSDHNRKYNNLIIYVPDYQMSL